MSSILIKAVFGLLKAVVFVYDVITYIPYFIIYRPFSVLKRSRRLKGVPANSSKGAAYRYIDSPQLTTTLFPECTTLDHLFERVVQLYPKLPCLGTRQLLSEEDEVQKNGRVFKKLRLGEYSWLNYSEVAERVTNFGKGLLAIDQKPRQNIVIFAETRAEWMIAIQACFKYNFPVATLYATLSVDAVVHGINETEVTHVITTSALFPKFQAIADRLTHLQHIIVMTGGKRVPNITLPSNGNQLKVYSMGDVELRGVQGKDTTIKSPSIDDIAVVMYTSGSTGLPKGVLISHRNLMAGMSGQCERIPVLRPPNIYIGYLPLAHVLELSAELSCVAHGVCIGYSSPLTLTDQSSKIMRGTKGDISVLKPQFMAAVPVIMDRLYKGVTDKISKGSYFAQELFAFAYQYKLRNLERGFDTPILNMLIFNKIRKLLGGNIKLMLCGGAPLSDTTQKFMNVCFCCPVGQGYGLTETCGAGTVTEVSEIETGRVGAPLQCNEIRLRDWPEGKYTSSDKPFPRGEVLIGGGNITMGYYKNPEKTREDFMIKDGIRYFCSGDIGLIDGDGCLKIIDRKKDLVKLPAGEYVSLSKIETVLKMSPLVDQICVCANSYHHFTVLLIVPNSQNVYNLSLELGLEPSDFDDMCQSAVVINGVLRKLTELAAKSGLDKIETPQKIFLCPDPWTPDTGLVTEAFKLKRKAIDDHFKAQITYMFSQLAS